MYIIFNQEYVFPNLNKLQFTKHSHIQPTLCHACDESEVNS